MLKKRFRDLRLSFPREDKRVAWAGLKEMADVSTALTTLLEKADAVYDVLEAFADRGKSLDNCHKRIEAVMAALDQFNDREGDEYIRWLELARQRFFPAPDTAGHCRRVPDTHERLRLHKHIYLGHPEREPSV